ncbi:unnamed protein product, partial [Prorocentrum cordatum]
EPFDILVNKSSALEWGAEWEKVSYGGSEGLRLKRAPSAGAFREWGRAHPDRLLLPRDVAIEVRREDPDHGSAHTYADMEKMLAGGGVLSEEQRVVPGPVSVALEKPRDQPIGLGWKALAPQGAQARLRITSIEGGGLFDESAGADPERAGQRAVIVGDTILQVRRTDPGEARLARSSEEMEHLLGRVGSLEVVVHREAPRDDYRCTPGLNNLPSEWTHSKKAWCCDQLASSGLLQTLDECKSADAPSDANASSTTPADDPDSFDCAAGLDKAGRGWSEAKKAWCCAHEQKGCEEPADTSASAASVPDTSDRQATQEGQALVIVSGDDAHDDFNDKYQDVVEWTIRSVFGYTEVQLAAAPRLLRPAHGPSLSGNASGPLRDRDDGGSRVFHYDMKGTCRPGCKVDRPPKERSNEEFRHELEQNLDAYNAHIRVGDARVCFGAGCQLRPNLPLEFAAQAARWGVALFGVALAALGLAVLGARCAGEQRGPAAACKEEQRRPFVVHESDAAPSQEPLPLAGPFAVDESDADAPSLGRPPLAVPFAVDESDADLPSLGPPPLAGPFAVDESDADAPALEPPPPLQQPPTDTLPTEAPRLPAEMPAKVSMIEWLDGLAGPSPRAGSPWELDPD